MDVFILRKITYAPPWGIPRIYKVSVVNTFEEAVAMAPQMDLEPAPCFLFEIVKVPLGEFSAEYFPETWYLDNKGKLISRDCPAEAEKIEVKVGDIVKVRPFPEIKCSQVYAETIGIVVEKNDVTADNADKTNELVVVTVDDKGVLDHYHTHTCSESMTVLKDEDVPERLAFLKIFREHMAGQKVIKEEIWKEIVEGNISVSNCRNLNWGQPSKLIDIEFE